ncbi:HeH/LEM domain-containing protein [Streptococcus gordonii]
MSELKEQLDAQGIAYDADAKKADLVALLQGNKEG